MSQSRRAAIECIFGYGRQHGTLRKTKHRGIASVTADFLLNLIAYNLARIPKLTAAWTRADSVRNRPNPLKSGKNNTIHPSKLTQLRKNGEPSRRFPTFSADCLSPSQ